MAQDALERLFSSNNQEESTYSVEEQLDSIDDDDDFLDGMSSAAEDALFKSVIEVTLDEPTSEELESEENDEVIVSNPSIIENSNESTKEELFNNNNGEDENANKKSRKTRKPRKTVDVNTNEVLSNAFNPIMDQLAKDVIDDLRKSKYKISRFDNNTMEIVFNYMYSKF